MAEFGSAVITDAGVTLLSQVMSGSKQIEFTALTVGDGVYSAEDKTQTALQAMTAMKNQRLSFGFSSVTNTSDSAVCLKAVVSNVSLAAGFYINEVGIWAKDASDALATPILYSIVVAETPDYLPPYNGSTPSTIEQDWYTTLANGASVTIDVSQSAYVLVSDFDTFKNNIAVVETASESAHDYEVGDYLIYAGVLYKVIASITAGDSFTVDTNIEATDICSNLAHIEKRVKYMEAVSAVAFNQRVDRNWNGLGSLAANATDVTADFDNGTLSQKIAACDFDDYDLGMQIKKTITIDGTDRVAHIIFAHANAFYGYDSYAMVNTPNIACVVYVEGLTDKWNASDTSGGYATSNLRTAIQKVVTALKTVLGESHMVKHQVLLSTAVTSGKSSSWAWTADSYGEAMSAAQMCGTEISGSFYDTGEAYEQLALFREVRPNQVGGSSYYPWLRDVLTAAYAAHLDYNGLLNSDSVTNSRCVSPLILLK